MEQWVNYTNKMSKIAQSALQWTTLVLSLTQNDTLCTYLDIIEVALEVMIFIIIIII